MGASHYACGGLGFGLVDEERHVIENLVFGDLLGTAEYVGLGDVREAELVDLDMGTEGDEANEGSIGQQIDSLGEGGLEEGELLFKYGSVDDKEEDGQGGSRSRSSSSSSMRIGW